MPNVKDCPRKNMRRKLKEEKTIRCYCQECDLKIVRLQENRRLAEEMKGRRKGLRSK